MSTFRDLINSYGLDQFATDISVAENTAKQMRTRNSVSPEYWDAWVAGAQRRGKNVTLEMLARLAAQKRGSRPAPEQQVA